MLIEVCCNSVQSALNAQEAGADRIELCSELGVGGVTSSFGLIKLVRERLKIPVHVLIRPRGGHFTYCDTEFEIMLEDIEKCHDLGVDGIVSGVLSSNADIDVERTQKLIELTGSLHFTFHRAFDWLSNPQEVLKKLENLGVKTVLTSGRHLTAEDGIHNLKKWQTQTDMTIMAGSGVNPNNISLFVDAGLQAVHLSGTHFQNEVSLSRKISMLSAKHLEEHHVAVTNTEVVRQIVQAVK